MQNNDVEFINALAEIMQNTGLTHISIKKKDCDIELGREIYAPSMAYIPNHQIPMPMATSQTGAPAISNDDAKAVAKASEGTQVKSPVVGTVFLQPKPGEPPYIKAGDKVQEGQILMIVEAMKVMNPITAPRAGTLKQILVEDADPVQYDQPLAVIL